MHGPGKIRATVAAFGLTLVVHPLEARSAPTAVDQSTPPPREDPVALRQPFRLEYRASSECPDQSAFAEQVLARAVRAESVQAGEHAPRVAVVIGPRNGRYAGELAIDEGVPRVVSDDSCADVVSALAFIAALTLDAQAPISTHASPEPRPAEPANLPPGRSAGTRHAGLGTGWFFGGGARLDIGRGLGPRAMTAFGPSAWIEARMEAGGLLAPTLRAGVRYAMSPQIKAADGAARFTWFAARVEGCPLRFAWRRLALLPCVAFEAGAMEGRAEVAPASIVHTYSGARTWLAWAQSLSLEVSGLGPLAFAASVELREPLRHYVFAFRTPDTTIAEVSDVELVGAAGAVVRFW